MTSSIYPSLKLTFLSEVFLLLGLLILIIDLRKVDSSIFLDALSSSLV